MANRQKGETGFDALGQTWTLRYGTNALCEIEDLFGRSALDVVDADQLVLQCQEILERFADQLDGEILVIPNTPVHDQCCHARDHDVALAYRAQEQLRIDAAEQHVAIRTGQQEKPGQTCWLCEERRKCALINGQWECRTCRTSTG